jgi:transcriptional regulator with GAF, ATPase, and Fis domain
MDHVDDDALRRVLDRLEPRAGEAEIEVALREVCDAAAELLGVDGSGLLLVDEGRVQRSTVATDEHGRELEEHQEVLGEGPCVDALMVDTTVHTADVTCDERWPRLGKVLGDRSVRAVVGAPIHVGGQPVGSINAYRMEPYEWDESDLAALGQLSVIAGRVLSTALLASSKERVVEQLQEALENRVAIERAVGFLMGRQRLGPVDAFERLRQRARSERRKVVEVANDVLEGRIEA